jgi:hypothetical protein
MASAADGVYGEEEKEVEEASYRVTMTAKLMLQLLFYLFFVGRETYLAE